MPGPTGPSPKQIGLTISALMLVVFAFIIYQSISNAPKTTTAPDPFDQDSSEIPDLNELEQGDSMFVTIADRNDPTRVAGTLRAEQFEPIGAGQRRLVNPDAWIYMSDGRRVHITADNALVLMPDPNQAPDAGTLEGDVTITTFPPSSSSSNQTDTSTDNPLMSAVFEEPVEFERRYQRLSSEGRFTIDSPQVSFAGIDLTIMLNDVQNRIELIDVRQGEQLVIRPNAQTSSNEKTDTKEEKPIAISSRVQSEPAKNTPSTQPASTQTTSPQTASSTTSTPAKSSEPIAAEVADNSSPSTSQTNTEATATLNPYRIQIDDQVKVNLLGSGTLTSDHLTIWTLLTDGTLSQDAIKQIQFAATSEQPTPQTQSDQSTQSSPAQSPPTSPRTSTPISTPTSNPKTVQATESQPAAQTQIARSPLYTPPSEGDIVLTWTGPLVVRPIDDHLITPLKDDHLALAFTSGDSISIDAESVSLSGKLNALTYAATQGILDLTSNEESMVLEFNQAGAVTTRELTANLDSGIITLPTQGSIESYPAQDSPAANIAWTNDATFRLHTNDNDELTNRLVNATLNGSVTASRDNISLIAHTLIADFDPESAPEASLRTVQITQGDVTSQDSALKADDLTLTLVSSFDQSKVIPSTLTASGAVVGTSQEGRIETDALSATLARNYEGQTVVRTATATGNTSFLGQDETSAQGHEIIVDASRDHITINSNDTNLATASQAGSTIQGHAIDINTRSRAITVDSAGSFDHDILTEGMPTGGHLRVTWQDSMRFDDALGRIETVGNVKAISTPDAYTIDTLDADRLEIALTPAPGTGQITNPDDAQTESIQREFISARAFGRAIPGQQSEPARVVSKTYSPQDPNLVISSMHLQGPELIADNAAQTLTVPTQGLLVLLDRTPTDQDQDNNDRQNNASDSNLPETSGPGLTRLSWTGSMELNRATGTAVVLDNVAIRHKSLTTQRITDLGCQELRAEFTPLDSITPESPLALSRADATGRVRFSDSTQTLLSDHAIFNAVNETLFAFADDNRLVTLRDTDQPTPVSAKTLLWNLKDDLVEIDAPTPVRAPSRSDP